MTHLRVHLFVTFQLVSSARGGTENGHRVVHVVSVCHSHRLISSVKGSQVALCFVLPSWFPTPEGLRKGPKQGPKMGLERGGRVVPFVLLFHSPRLASKREWGPERVPKHGPTMGLERGVLCGSVCAVSFSSTGFQRPRAQ